MWHRNKTDQSDQVVVGGESDEPVESSRSNLRVPVFGIAATLVVVLVFSGQRFPTNEEEAEARIPGITALEGFVAALNAGDATDAAEFLHPDFSVLQIPDPLSWDYRFQALGESSLRRSSPTPPERQIENHLTVLANLAPNARVESCESEEPSSPRGMELYDHLVICTLLWMDALRLELGVEPLPLTIEAGISDGRIRGMFVDRAESDPDGFDQVVTAFIPWLTHVHPAVYVEILGHQNNRYAPIERPDTVADLIEWAAEFAMWVEHMDQTRSAPPQSGPAGRIDHFLVYDATAGRVLLLGGAVADDWAVAPFDRIWSFDVASRRWTPAGNVPSREGTTIAGAAYQAEGARLVVLSENTFTWELELLISRTGEDDWVRVDPLISGEEQSLDPPALLVWHSSPAVGVIPRSQLIWLFDGEEWEEAPQEWTTGYFELLRSVVDRAGIDPYYWRKLAVTPAEDILIGSGAGRVSVLNPATGLVSVASEVGPSVVSSATYISEAGAIVIVGDAALWSFDLETGAIERMMAVPQPVSPDGMYWRTAEAGYDDSSNLVIIFDGENTWTFDYERRVLEGPF